MKITCKQVPPEFVEAPDMYDDLGLTENDYCIYGFGNWENVNQDLFDDVNRFLEDAENGYIPENPKRTDARYRDTDLQNLTQIAKNLENRNADKETVVLVLNVLTGSTWDYFYITGACQGDKALVFYDTESIRDMECQLTIVETAYFNLGNEFEIIRSDSDISDYLYVYHCHDTDEQKNELLDYIRYNVNTPKNTEIEFLFFDGYNMIPKYKKG